MTTFTIKRPGPAQVSLVDIPRPFFFVSLSGDRLYHVNRDGIVRDITPDEDRDLSDGSNIAGNWSGNVLPAGTEVTFTIGENQWIEWDGSEYVEDRSEPLFTPVKRGLLLDVRLRNGAEYFNLPAGENSSQRVDAAGAFFKNEGGPRDIVAYRLSK